MYFNVEMACFESVARFHVVSPEASRNLSHLKEREYIKQLLFNGSVF